jgi:hypothetical protein
VSLSFQWIGILSVALHPFFFALQKRISVAVLVTEAGTLVDHGLSDEALNEIRKHTIAELRVELDAFGWPYKSKMNKGDLLNALLLAYANKNNKEKSTVRPSAVAPSPTVTPVNEQGFKPTKAKKRFNKMPTLVKMMSQEMLPTLFESSFEGKDESTESGVKIHASSDSKPAAVNKHNTPL